MHNVTNKRRKLVAPNSVWDKEQLERAQSMFGLSQEIAPGASSKLNLAFIKTDGDKADFLRAVLERSDLESDFIDDNSLPNITPANIESGVLDVIKFVDDLTVIYKASLKEGEA